MGRELERSRPFYFRGCDLTAEYLLAMEEVRAQLPAAAPFMHRLSVSTRPSFQNSAYSGQHGGSLPFSRVVADKQCTGPASRLIWARYPPTPPFHCGENEIQASPISSASVGATPTPATNFREVIRLPVCKTGVSKQAGSDDWSVTSTSHHPSLKLRMAVHLLLDS